MHRSHSRPQWTVVSGLTLRSQCVSRCFALMLVSKAIDFRWRERWKSCSPLDLAGPLGILLTLVPSPFYQKSSCALWPLVHAFCDETLTIPASWIFF